MAKETKKDEKKKREVVKVKLAILANKLFKENKITKSLYNKMYNLSIGHLDFLHLIQLIEVLKISKIVTLQ